MSDNGPCNCDQSCNLTEALEAIVTHVEEHVAEYGHYPLRELAAGGRSVLEKYAKAELDASKCEHCGLIGGH